MTPPNTEREIHRRRRYGPAFKTNILTACLQGNASIVRGALQYGLNTNLVQTWIRKAKREKQWLAVPDFLPLPVSLAKVDLPAPATACREICIELPSTHGTHTVHWLVAEAAQCAQCLKESQG